MCTQPNNQASNEPANQTTKLTLQAKKLNMQPPT